MTTSSTTSSSFFGSDKPPGGAQRLGDLAPGTLVRWTWSGCHHEGVVGHERQETRVLVKTCDTGFMLPANLPVAVLYTPVELGELWVMSEFVRFAVRRSAEIAEAVAQLAPDGDG